MRQAVPWMERQREMERETEGDGGRDREMEEETKSHSGLRLACHAFNCYFSGGGVKKYYKAMSK